MRHSGFISYDLTSDAKRINKKQIGLHVLLQSVNPLFVHAVSLLTVKTLRRWLGISIFIVPSSLYLLFAQYCYIYFLRTCAKSQVYIVDHF